MFAATVNFMAATIPSMTKLFMHIFKSFQSLGALHMESGII